ncbi:MAG TPA: hypothetical protein GXX29_15525 [Firmicutes bacterium]|nr:hypothetical protein [Bacillota bacterium]
MTGLEMRNCVRVRSHFFRSINIREDLSSEETIKRYIVTPELEELAETIMQSINDPDGSRAWAITGPYGSGKSAFGLFLTDVLCSDNYLHAKTPSIRLKTGWNQRFLPILVSGHRTRLTQALLSALANAIEPFDPSQALRIRDFPGTDTANSMWHFFDELLSIIKKRGFSGLLVIIDEFGKFLEYAVSNPESEDLIILQYLAEYGDRRVGEFFLITILHSAFADYLPAGSRVMRTEWQKIQGRFRDHVFTTSLNQHLTLLASAIDAELDPEINEAYNDVVQEVLKLHGLRHLRSAEVYTELLRGCVPLHPLTALLTWPVFRGKMAQNERSLFSFLSSHENKGFAWFVDRQVWERGEVPLYRIADLYDYVVNALGSAVAFGEHATKWSEIADTIDRLDSTAPPLAADVVKTIGMLTMYGPAVGLDASFDAVKIAVGQEREVNAAIAYLEKNEMILYRRYLGAYGIWAGSDIDLDKHYEHARHQLSARSLAERLENIFEISPIVARKHFIETGTLRTFAVRVIDGLPSLIKECIEKGPPEGTDGLIVYVLSDNETDRHSLIDLACQLTAGSKDSLIIFAFPKFISGLQEVVIELESWLWILNNVPSIKGDRVARNELKARINHFTQRVINLAGRILGLRGCRHEPQVSDWVHNGGTVAFHSARQFASWLSYLCKKVYWASPVIPNELINRRYLSSAAVAARRNLMEAMIEREYEVNLGLEGGAAETTMYFAVLARSGLHKSVGSKGYFDDPGKEWEPLWQAIEDFLEGTQKGPKPVTTLYSILSKPPFGLRLGVLPVVVLAFVLRRRHEVALYENNVYVPGIRVDVIERLSRQPEKFAIRSFKINPAYKALLEQVAKIPLLADKKNDRLCDHERLLGVVEPLVRFVATLNPYAKLTRRFNDARVADVRLVIMRASDPYDLIFKELPQVFGLNLEDNSEAKQFVEGLGNAITELGSAYANLLSEVESELYTAFGLEPWNPDALMQLKKQAASVRQWASTPQLKRFIMEITRDASADWRPGIGRAVMDGVSPSQWTDRDVPEFRARLHLLAGDFVRLLELAKAKEAISGNKVVRVSLLDGTFEETRALTVVPQEWEDKVDILVDKIQSLLKEHLHGGIPENEILRRAVLARALMNETRETKHE